MAKKNGCEEIFIDMTGHDHKVEHFDSLDQVNGIVIDKSIRELKYTIGTFVDIDLISICHNVELAPFIAECLSTEILKNELDKRSVKPIEED